MNMTPMANDFVARVSGIDLKKRLDEAQLAAIVAGLDQYAVLIFPGQPMTQGQQVEFTERFGPLDYGPTKALNLMQTRLKESALSDISNVDVSGKVAARTHQQTVMNIGNMQWHSDSSYAPYPFRYSVLNCQVPAKWGGQTEFADLRAAYDTLDEHLLDIVKDKIGRFFALRGRDQLGVETMAEIRDMFPPVRWPLIRTHAATGRKILWVGTPLAEIEGMALYEGRMLAHALLEHATRPERVYSHSWTAGDLIVWDNRSMLHRGRWFDLDERREMRRAGTTDDVGSIDASTLGRNPGHGQAGTGRGTYVQDKDRLAASADI